jgi:hypothetical protein
MSEFIEALGRIVESVAGLRFLFSRQYRARTRERWRAEPWPCIFIECFGALMGIVLLGLILSVVGHSLFSSGVVS